VTLAVGIIGATIMPHTLYLHSGLTQNRTPARNDEERRQLLAFSNREVLVALGIAGFVNLAMPCDDVPLDLGERQLDMVESG
jgi:manganese transport protein